MLAMLLFPNIIRIQKSHKNDMREKEKLPQMEKKNKNILTFIIYLSKIQMDIGDVEVVK